MKKNRLLIITILLISFFAFGLVAKAQTRDVKRDYTKQIPQIVRQVEGTQVGGSSGSTGTTVGKSGGIDLCQNAGVVKSAQIVGWMLFVIKIVAPLILIIMGIIEIAKAVVSNDDKAIKVALSALVKRAIAAVVIFFVPTIIALIFNLVGNASEAKGKFSCLSTCISTPSSCTIPNNELFK